MTGKSFKEWAATVPDEATIETQTGGYQDGWRALYPASIRAVMKPKEMLQPLAVTTGTSGTFRQKTEGI